MTNKNNFQIFFMKKFRKIFLSVKIDALKCFITVYFRGDFMGSFINNILQSTMINHFILVIVKRRRT